MIHTIRVYIVLLSLTRCFAVQKTELCMKSSKIVGIEAIVTDAPSYIDLIKHGYMFVDKTLLIKEFLEHEHKSVFIAQPLKWGKNINANMIKTFLEIEVDHHGVPIQRDKCTNYKLFEKGRIMDISFARYTEIFPSLMISKYEQILRKYLGQYPVIELNFEKLDGDCDGGMVDLVGMMMQEIYSRHRYLMKDLKNIYDNETESEEIRLRAKSNFKIFRSIFENDNDEKAVLADSLQFICKLLYLRYNKKVFVFINNYDYPFSIMVHREFYDIDDVRPVMKFFQKFLKPLEPDYKYVERVLITSTFDLDNMPSVINTMKHYNLINNPWHEYFGFSRRNVCCIFEAYNIASGLQAQAHEWYDGYRVGENFTWRVYNPYSIAMTLKHNHTDPFLSNVSSIDFLNNVMKIKPFIETVEYLINKHDLRIELTTQFTKKDIFTLKRLFFRDQDHYSNKTKNMLLSYLVSIGYLAIHNRNETTNEVSVYIPNQELLTILSRKLLLVYFQRYDLTQSKIDKAITVLSFFFLKDSSSQIPFRLLKYFQYIMDNITPKIFDGSGNLAAKMRPMYAVLNFLSIKLRHMYKYNTQVFQDGTRSFMLINKDNISAITVAELCAENMEELITKATTEKHLLEQYGFSAVIKYLAVNVDSNRTVKMQTSIEILDREILETERFWF